MQPMANALSTTVVCVVALGIFSDSDAVVVVPRLAWGLTELLDENVVGRDAFALELGTGGIPSSGLLISTWRETSFATVSRRMMSD